MGWRVAQQALRLADVGLAVAHVSRPKVAVHGLGVSAHAVGSQVDAQQGKQFVECGAVTHSHVVNLIQCGIHELPRFARNDGLDGGSQQVGLHGIRNKAEIAAGFTVAVDINLSASQQRCCPFWDDGGIGAIGVLTRAEDVEVAQADGVKAIAASKHVGIQLVDVFGHGVRTEGLANHVFHLGKAGMVAIGAAACSIGEAFDPGVARGNQHV